MIGLRAIAAVIYASASGNSRLVSWKATAKQNVARTVIVDNLLVYAVSFLSTAVPRQTTPSLHALVHRLDRHLVKGRVYLLLRGGSSH